MKHWGPIVFIFLLFTGSCNKRPEEVLNENEMVSLLTDLQLAEAYLNTTGPNKIDREGLMLSVLEKHGVTRAQFDSTTAYYGRNLDEYMDLYTKVERNIQKRDVNKRNNETLLSADDIWPYNRFSYISGNQLTDGITFSFPADKLEKGNSLVWSGRMTSSNSLALTFGVEYENGTTSIHKTNSSGEGNFTIDLQTDTAKTPKRIFGTLKVSQVSMPVWLDSLRMVKNPYDSITYLKIRQQRNIGVPVKAKPSKPDSLINS